MSAFSDLRLLLWKNYILQKRHPIATFVEILVPTLFMGLLVLIRLKVDFTEEANNSTYPKTSLDIDLYESWYGTTIIYSPNSSKTNDFMSKLKDDYKKSGFVGKNFKIMGFPSEERMLSHYLQSDTENRTIICGIVFENQEFDKELKYKLRFPDPPYRYPIGWQTRYTFPLITFQNREPMPNYESERFLNVEHKIATTLLKYLNKTVNSTEVIFQRFPYPPYIEDGYLIILSAMFPFILLMSFIYPAVNLTKNLVIEKEKRLKESMKMMGLKEWVHWMAWFIKSLFWLAISSGIISLFLTIHVKEGLGIYTQSNVLVIYLFFISYSISCICFCFLLSTFFSKSNVSAITSGILIFLSYMPYFILSPRYPDLKITEKLLSCLFCNSALAFGSVIITNWERNNAGLQWSNLSLGSSPDDTLTVLHIITMFFVDAFIYLCLTLYIEAVFPGDFGIAKKWYFPITCSYWCGHKIVDNKTEANGNVHNEFLEKEPIDLKPGIKILNLSKTFDGHTFAVKDLSFTAYKGQITGLLGHNGAGKTTTMSIITGLFPPSGGTAIVNGCDIRKDMDRVRSSLGICPQFDVLFDELTVEEHLKFFCQLKNYDKTKSKEEIKVVIEKLGLIDKKNKCASTLSGGQKRKLSIGIALVGKSEIVILDEPTSGMDVYARRFTWELLLAEKVNRTMLLSTHFMEEADILSERIAIMSNGKLQCCGSPLFLKKKYGVGYNMTIVKTDYTDVKLITQLIESYIKDSKLQSSAGTEISFSLPKEKSEKFEELFTAIESRKEELGIESFGVSITTMEEVFLKVGEYAEKGMEALKAHHNTDTKDVVIKVNNKSDERNTGCSLIRQQFKGLLTKKILYSFRNPVLTISQLLLLMGFAVYTILLLLILPKIEERPPPLILNLDNFKGTEIPYFFNDKTDPDIQKIVSHYKSQFSGTNRVYEKLFTGTKLTESMNEYILEKSLEDIAYFNLHVPIGAIFCNNANKQCSVPTVNNVTVQSSAKIVVTALFNGQPFHSSAISLAAVDLAVIRYTTDLSNYILRVTNHPFPRKLKEIMKSLPNQSNNEAFTLAFNIMFAMAFLAATFAIFLVKESSVKLKHLQLVSGAKLYLFWSTVFLWDYLIYIISCILVILVWFLWGDEFLTSIDQEFRIMVIFIFHGFALLPFVYFMSLMFGVPSTAYVRICIFCLFVGMGALIAVTILELIELKDIAKLIDIVFGIGLPNYTLGRAMYFLRFNYAKNEVCNTPNEREKCLRLANNPNDTFTERECCRELCRESDRCIEWNDNYFAIEKPGIGKILIFFVIQCIVFWFLIVLVEKDILRKLIYLLKCPCRAFQCIKRTFKFVQKLPLDPDVKLEEERIEKTDLKKLFETDALIIKKLAKFYGDFCAVDYISYGVKRGECFGLLGVNGAGKTTTFKMITGDESISSGDIYVNGYAVKSNIKQVQKQMGYCPQFDGLLDQLTGRETLILFCRLRGIKNSDINRHIVDISKLLYFDMHINKLVKNYSGGTKRKLSTAVALLGDPSVSFLDEPTTGVDPVARRCLWDALTKKLSEGRSIVLTSHSMEECEALCNRLIIMVNGKICCIGSPQQLKNKFGKGYTVHIKVLTSGEDLAQTTKKVEEFMKETFEGTEVKEIHYNSLNFQINNTTITWAQIFGAIEKSKNSLNIEDYSVGQTTLEQIFLTFAAKQNVVKS